MSVLVEVGVAAAVAWVVLFGGLVGALWMSGPRRCRAAGHSWWWEGGQWVCGRCGAPDDRTNREVTR